ncbi:uncharacterized protein LOC144642967 [Oculina patagonica]
MKSRIVEGISIALVLLLWLQPVAGSPTRCSLIWNFVIIFPHVSGAKPGCRPCPDCPVGQGVSPQCGSRITNETRIECKQCLANENYSDSHGIGSCKPCNECGLKNVIQNCTASQNRKCGKDCPKGYFLNDNDDCQEEATSEPTGTKPTSTAVHNTTDEKSKTQVYNATALPAKKSSNSEMTPTAGLENRELTTPPPPTANDLQFAGDQKERTVGETTFIVVVAILVLVVIVTAVLAPIICWVRSRTESVAFGGSAGENVQLTSRELNDSEGSTQVDDVLDTEVAEPINVELIPADYHVSDMESLCDDDNQPMLFYVKSELDAIESVSRKTWRSVGQALKVSSTHLDLIETEYKSGGSPTEILIKKLKTRSKEPTLREFVQSLVACERHDVASYICNWPWEKLQKSKDQPSVGQPDTNLLLE